MAEWRWWEMLLLLPRLPIEAKHRELRHSIIFLSPLFADCLVSSNNRQSLVSTRAANNPSVFTIMGILLVESTY